jgi:hypothetical protein
MAYLRNTWYVAAWCDEVHERPLGRQDNPPSRELRRRECTD